MFAAAPGGLSRTDIRFSAQNLLTDGGTGRPMIVSARSEGSCSRRIMKSIDRPAGSVSTAPQDSEDVKTAEAVVISPSLKGH